MNLEQSVRHLVINESIASVKLVAKKRLTLHRRQAKLLRNLRVLDPRRILQLHAPYQLRQVARARDGASAAKRLEFDVTNGVVVGVDSDLEFHDIAACRCADQSCANIAIGFRHGANISGLVVVIEQCGNVSCAFSVAMEQAQIEASVFDSMFAQRGYLSFSWYCRLPTTDIEGTALRMGDAMLGLAAVASTRPAWAGAAAATLLNMMIAGMCAESTCFLALVDVKPVVGKVVEFV
jgi:hypothetical protein